MGTQTINISQPYAINPSIIHANIPAQHTPRREKKKKKGVQNAIKTIVKRCDPRQIAAFPLFPPSFRTLSHHYLVKGEGLYSFPNVSSCIFVLFHSIRPGISLTSFNVEPSFTTEYRIIRGSRPSVRRISFCTGAAASKRMIK